MTDPSDPTDAAAPPAVETPHASADSSNRPLPGPGLPSVRQLAAGPASVAAGPVKAVVETARQGGQLARRPRPGVLAVGPSLARVAAESAWQLASWSLGATVASANFVVKRAMDGESPSAIISDAAHELRRAALHALGVNDVVAAELLNDESVDGPDLASAGAARAQTSEELQRRGTELLRRSNDVHVVEDTHPAFARILTEITPDEARMLRYLYLEGPQPSVDVRTFRPFGIGSVLIAGGMNMIAEYAGSRNPARARPYLTNLARLGLVDFSKEQVSNPGRYQVIEAQPKVVEAIKRAGRFPKIVHRRIQLTEFGEEFVRTCLPLNGRVLPYRDRVLEAGESERRK
jgi:hypothetical protein